MSNWPPALLPDVCRACGAVIPGRNPPHPPNAPPPADAADVLAPLSKYWGPEPSFVVYIERVLAERNALAALLLEHERIWPGDLAETSLVRKARARVRAIREGSK